MPAVLIKKHLIICLLTLLLAACGDHYTQTDKYIGVDKTKQNRDEPYSIDVIILPTRLPSSIPTFLFLFVDTHEINTAPYKMIVVARYYGKPKQPVLLHDVQLEYEGNTTSIYNKATPYTLRFEPWLEHAVSGNVEWPLDDILNFEEGAVVKVTVTYTHPDTGVRTTFFKTFKGKRKHNHYDIWDIFASI